MSSAQKRLHFQLEEQRNFETLLIDLSTRFVNVAADQVDREIADAQRRVCECLQLDSSLLWQSTNAPSARFKLSHMYRPLGGPPPPTQAEVETTYPWACAQLLDGRMYVNSTLDDLPPEAACDRIAFERYGVKSNVGLPLAVGGGPLLGGLTFNTVRAPRIWTEEILKRLQLVGQIFANALARKTAVAEAQMHQRQLARLHRVATMGELATALAHELNQPLGAILRNAEAAELLLRDDAPDLDELRAIVADIKRDDQRAGGVIDSLRAFLRQRSLTLQTVDLVRLADEVVALAFPDATTRGIRVVNEIAAGLPAVRCDRVHVQQVLLNLIMNGMDAIGENVDADARVTIGARRAGSGQVEVWVGDTGHGIAPESLRSLFEPFFTTKASGIGMGLVISRTLVEAHGGRIWADAASDHRGASLHFTLPIAVAEGTE